MKSILLSLTLYVAFFETTNTHPNGYYYQRVPQRTVMFGGYYGHPMETRGYVPQGSMTFAAGDTIATNAFVGDQPQFQNPSEELDEEVANDHPQKRRNNNPQMTEDEFEAANVDEETPIEPSPKAKSNNNTPKTKRRNNKPAPTPGPVAEEEDDDDAAPSNWPFQSGPGRNGGSSYNAFFPIMLGGSSRTRSGGEEGYYPGAATAIANSFSTGKGGVSSSHATSFGDPYMGTMLRNHGNNGVEAKNNVQQQQHHYNNKQEHF